MPQYLQCVKIILIKAITQELIKEEQINKLGIIETVDYYTTVKVNELHLYVSTRIK